MAGRLKDKKSLITAAGKGIGRSTVLAFVHEGARVLATDVDQDSLDSLKKECPEIETRLLDVTNPEEIQAIAEETGAIDILFNCAGFVHHGTLLDCEESDWEFSFDVELGDLKMKATIADGWHLYSQSVSEDIGPIPCATFELSVLNLYNAVIVVIVVLLISP